MKLSKQIHSDARIRIGVTMADRWYKNPIHWKPYVSPHRQSVATMRYKELAEDRTEIYDTQHGLMTHFIQVFFLCFIFWIDIPHVTKGYGKGEYKRHERTYANKDGELTKI